jgi:phosphoenolpyruvate-protein kinase (PTS system EI component)
MVTAKLIELGVDELSVSPSAILPLKEKILNL